MTVEQAGYDGFRGRPIFAIRSNKTTRRLTPFVLALATSIFLLATTTTSASALTLGLTWRNGDPADIEIVRRSGAKDFQMGFDMGTSGGNPAHYDSIVAAAARNGIRIHPVLVGTSSGPRFLRESDPAWSDWHAWTKQAVERFGINGTLWEQYPSLPYRPILTWEVWNEPNFAANNPILSKVACEAKGQPFNANANTCVQPKAYGKFLNFTATAIQAGSQARASTNTTVLFGGLYMPGGEYYGAFLEKAHAISGVSTAYSGLSIHPYAHVNSIVPTTEMISTVRSILDNNIPSGGTKSLWITELGWATYRDEASPSKTFPTEGFPVGGAPVSEIQQASLLTQIFNWAKGVAAAKNIQFASWFNIQEYPSGGKWEGWCGLRNIDGRFRPAWNAYRGQTGALPDLYAVQMNNMATEETSVHVLNGISNYASWGRQVSTPLGETSAGQWRWEMGDTLIDGKLDGIADLVGIEMNNTETHQTVVHVLNGATQFQSWGIQYPTPLGETSPDQWQWLIGDSDTNGDGIPDLVGVAMNKGGSKHTEVHVLNGATQFRSWLAQVPTPLSETTPAQWQWVMGDVNGDRVPDLVGVKMNNTGSKKTEVHVLNGATSFQTWLIQMATPLGETNPNQWQWTMTDDNADGISDLVGVTMNGTVSKKTDIHVLNGATSFQTWLTQVPTTLGETSPGQWRVLGEPKVGSNAGIESPPLPKEAPPVDAVITPEDELYVKAGNLFGEWVHLGNQIKSVSVASDHGNGPLIGVVTNNGHALVKKGLFGEWVDEGSSVSSVSVATDPTNGPLIGVVTNNGHALVKKGLFGEWVDESGNVSELSIATDSANGPLVGIRVGGGAVYVKKGNLFGEWVNQGTGRTSVSVATGPSTGPVVGVLTATGQALAKKNSLTTGWVEGAASASRFSVSSSELTGPFLGVLTSAGSVLVKQWSLYGEWIEEIGGVTRVAIAN